jgi:S-adenosylmethionine:tRNA ribosyltransferase-isomerase
MPPPTPYRLSDFDFHLPPELIAQRPAEVRSASRLLHVTESDLVDRNFTDLERLLTPGDLVVFNDTRVIRSRLYGRKATGGKVELMLERLLGGNQAWMQCRASHAPGIGMRIDLARDASATVLERDGRFVRLRLDAPISLTDYLECHAEVPLPPYITRGADAADSDRYQTIYAKHPGAVAAPTAGLHFDQSTLNGLRSRGVEFAYVTLHVGAGTFQPVDSDDLSQHRMHVESFNIPASTALAVGAARARGACVVAIGTTSLRALESAATDDGSLRAGDAETRLFITPGYRFRVVDRLLTNFHLPRSTLLMLVSAFAGYDRIRAAYAHAVAGRYRFFSYGDAMLLERQDATA